jgi:hypothetical protein
VAWSLALDEVRHGQYTLAEAETASPEASVWFFPATVWDTGRARLYLVHAEAERLTTVDFAAQRAETVAIAAAHGWLDRLLALTAGVVEAKMMNGTQRSAVLSADGEQLYVTGSTTTYVDGVFSETPLGVDVVEAATGRLLEHIDSEGRSPQLAPDGEALYLEAWGQGHHTEVRRLDSLDAVVMTVPEARLVAGRLPSGEAVVLSIHDQPERTSITVRDPETLAPLAQWWVRVYGEPVLGW